MGSVCQLRVVCQQYLARAAVLVADQVGELLDMKNMLIWVSKEICVAFVQAEKQVHLASCLDKLMTDVHRNLEPKNRDRFTQVQFLIYMFLTGIALPSTSELAAVFRCTDSETFPCK